MQGKDFDPADVGIDASILSELMAEISEMQDLNAGPPAKMSKRSGSTTSMSGATYGDNDEDDDEDDANFPVFHQRQLGSANAPITID